MKVKFAKDTLPMVPDHDSVTEDSILLTDVGSAVGGKGNYNDEHDEDETSALLQEAAMTEQNKNDSEAENVSEQENEDKRRLVPRRGHKSWAESEYEDEDDEEDFDVQSDSRYTSSYVTENTEDSLTGALDNRVIYSLLSTFLCTRCCFSVHLVP